MSDFLKHGFLSHVDHEDCTHKICAVIVGIWFPTISAKPKQGLKEMDSRRTGEWTATCTDFLIQFQVVEDIRGVVEADKHDLKSVIDEASQKLKLILEHQVRFKDQNKIIDEV